MSQLEPATDKDNRHHKGKLAHIAKVLRWCYPHEALVTITALSEESKSAVSRGMVPVMQACAEMLVRLYIAMSKTWRRRRSDVCYMHTSIVTIGAHETN